MRGVLWAIALLLFLASPALGDEDNSWTKEEKVFAFNTVATSALLTWGVFMWDYGENLSHVQSEGWFGTDTKHGGADKTGHIYVAYLLGRGSAEKFIDWGYTRDEAANLGVYSSLLFTTIMEAGDSFSDFGLSPQDLVANLVGTGLGYLLVKYPKAGEILDMRVEYAPTEWASDPTIDYEHMKHLLALRFGGFDSLKDSYWRYLEVHLGYYTRKFHHVAEGDEERVVEVALSLDLSEVFSGSGFGGLFRYFRPPSTYLATHREY